MDRTLISLTTSSEQSKLLEITTKASALKKRLVKTWTAAQDEKLVALYDMHPKKWNIIAEKMKNRNQNQCLHRFRRICRLGQSKKIWSPQEDEVVLKMIREVGHNWRLIAEELGTKSGKQIRERFINKLDPNIRREEWTAEEDMKIIELYSKMGSKWCEISKCLPGRPQNRIKNRFYSYIQKNYDFRVKDRQLSKIEEIYEDKENTKQPISFSNGQKVTIQKKQSAARVLQERVQNQSSKIDIVKQEPKQDSIQEEKENNQYNSLKEINEECFFKYSSNANNADLLYFEDN